MTDLIDREEFIGIFPSGYNGRWNVGGQTSADDIEFVSSIINVLSGADIFDTENIYGIGTSNGGGMVNKLAKETSIFRAIAPVISSQTALLGELVPSQPVSVFQVNAENDSAIPLEGGQGVGNQEFMSAQASAENWATNFNCNLTPVSEPVAWGDYSGTEYTFDSCLNGERVRYVVVDGAGHSPYFGSGFNLYERIWQFFESGDDL